MGTVNSDCCCWPGGSSPASSQISWWPTGAVDEERLLVGARAGSRFSNCEGAPRPSPYRRRKQRVTDEFPGAGSPTGKKPMSDNQGGAIARWSRASPTVPAHRPKAETGDESDEQEGAPDRRGPRPRAPAARARTDRELARRSGAAAKE